MIDSKNCQKRIIKVYHLFVFFFIIISCLLLLMTLALFEFQNLVAVDAMYTYLDILFLMQLDDTEEEKIRVAENCLISTCVTIIRTYISHSIQIVPQPDRQKSVTHLRPRTRSTRPVASPKQMARLKEITEITVPVLLLILEKIFEFPDDKVISFTLFYLSFLLNY